MTEHVIHNATPRPRGPRDLPDLRAHLLDRWGPGQPFTKTAETIMREQAETLPGINFTTFEPRFERRALRDAALWWIDADATDIVRASYHTFSNDYVLNMDDLTHHTGLAMFATPLQGLDSQHEGEVIQVDAILWGPVTLIPLPEMKDRRERKGITISSYSWWNYDDGLSSLQLENEVAIQQIGRDSEPARHLVNTEGVAVTMHGGFWVPLGRSDWLLGERVDAPVEEVQNDSVRFASMMEDRQLAATVWHLARQPHVIETRVESLTGPARRRATRKGHSPDINVMRLRPVERVASGEGREVHWQHRWLVRAHWRNQPYGPGNSLRKPKLVRPALKGPPGAPFKAPKPTVWWLEGD